jgi:hypothetical protein
MVEDQSEDFPHLIGFPMQSQAERYFKWTHNWDGRQTRLTIQTLGMGNNLKEYFYHQNLREYEDYVYWWTDHGIVMGFKDANELVMFKLGVLSE